MKNKVFLALVICLVGNSLADNDPNWIEQWGIRWTFDKPISKDGTAGTYRYGQFCNGDYWVVGPVKIVSITPPSIESNGRIINGSMINPTVGLLKQGYDSALGNYVASLNVAFNVSNTTPLTVEVGSSLISTISLIPEVKQKLRTAAVLTVLSEVPPINSFRPPYLGTNKMVKYNSDMLRIDLLPKLKPVPNTPTLTVVERYFERVWLLHFPGYGVTYLAPIENVRDYGRDLSVEVGKGALSLCLNYTNEQKLSLLKKYIQVGIDLYRFVEDNANKYWAPDGGCVSGRKLPILVAGYLLNDAGML
jgi:pSer/pThr/pTyr-binding forkhead associated (FHA) protein